MNQHELKLLLDTIQGVKIGIIGDFCLDAYFLLEPGAAEPSLETGLLTRPVRSQRYSLGAAGNVTSNLRAMGVRNISVFGVVGPDPFGEEMKRLLAAHDVDASGILMQGEQWDTHVYMKPYEREQEQQRIDLGNFNHLHPLTAKLLLEKIEAALPRLDLVIVNQQVPHGLHTKEFRDQLSALVLHNAEKPFIADSRHFADEYAGSIRKINILEAARISGRDLSSLDTSALKEATAALYDRWRKPVFLTRGENGCSIFDENGYHEIPGLLILSPVDPVGAGDSMLAGIASALAASATTYQAGELGSLVAGVTVQKLMQTGTATAEEILNIGADPDRRFQPDLAQHARKARYHKDTEIEIVTSPPEGRTFSHVILDHDGTISTLRQGWESIMEPMMVRAILGSGEHEQGEALHDHVVAAVRDYVDKTTGLQTLAQMKGLVNLVRRFKCVPEAEILDEFQYKRLYDEELLKMVQERIRKLQRKELSVDDFAIKNATRFVEAMHRRGVRLYLASGTDQKDVEHEAEILGYRSMFGNRIYGAVGDVTKEAKRMVLERILSGIGGEASSILTIGDGPVEIRETQKRGGYTIGVASDEVRRFGMNPSKRRRLIEAGADLVIADYSQMTALIQLLFA